MLEQQDDPLLDNGGRVDRRTVSEEKPLPLQGWERLTCVVMLQYCTPGDHLLALREKLVLKVIHTLFTSLGILRFFPPFDITFFLFQKLFSHDCEINVLQFNLGTNTVCT